MWCPHARASLWSTPRSVIAGSVDIQMFIFTGKCLIMFPHSLSIGLPYYCSPSLILQLTRELILNLMPVTCNTLLWVEYTSLPRGLNWPTKHEKWQVPYLNRNFKSHHKFLPVLFFPLPWDYHVPDGGYSTSLNPRIKIHGAELQQT